MPEGIGLSLSRRFFESVVGPVIEEHFSKLPFAAARIGRGSEVLGYDTDVSADHDYGPTVQLFLAEDQFRKFAVPLGQKLDEALPDFFEGWPVRFSSSTRPSPSITVGSDLMAGYDHGVELYAMSAWCQRFLQRPYPVELSLKEWLFYPEQLFLTATAGAVFRDDTGEITHFRAMLQYFPQDVWLYKLSAQWHLVAEERAYIGRTGDVGDDIGSRIISARMVENLMRLGFLIERQYAPYPKWFGLGFAKLSCAEILSPILQRVLSSPKWQDREKHLAEACQFLAQLQLELRVPGATAPEIGTLHGRQYHFIDTLKIGAAIQNAIVDKNLHQLPNFGAADQILKSNAILSVPRLAKASTEGVFATKMWWDYQ